MDAISVDVAGLTVEDRHGLSFEDFAEALWVILRFTYSGDNEVKVLRYSISSSINTEKQAQQSRSAFGYYIDRALSLDEIARTRRDLAELAHGQHFQNEGNAFRLHSIIRKAVLLVEYGDLATGTLTRSEINGSHNSEAAPCVDQSENLVVHVYVHESAPRVELRLPKTIGSQNSVTYVADTLSHLSRSLSQHPNLSLGDLNLVGPSNWNCIQRSAKAPSQGSNACLNDILTQHAIEHPEHIAIDSWDGMLTYSQLYHLSLRLAMILQDQGVLPEERILLCMKKSKWAVVAMFGILLIGATCIPLDINSPQKRWHTIHEMVATRFAVVDDSTASFFEEIGIKTLKPSVQLERDTNLEKPLPETTATATAFIYFTSGSTGTPKGVVLEHGVLRTAILEVAKAYSLDDTSRLFQYAAYAFDVSMGDIFGTLSRGGCLCIPSEDERMNDVSAAMNKLEATHACLTSTVLAQVKPKDVKSLRHLFVGGEALDQTQFPKWKQHVNFNVVYGTTESLIWDSLATSSQLELDSNNLGLSIGSWLWVVDPNEANKLKPIGAIGEILIEGPLLAKEYLDDPVTTKSKFINAPSWLRQLRQDRPIRCYKSGDMGYYNADGTVTFIGRADTQVKIRGQRIELQEIEHNISMLEPSFNKVVVEAVTLRCRQRSKTLAAFVDITPARSTEKEDGQGHGRINSLPAYLNGFYNGAAAKTQKDMRNLALPVSQPMTDLFQKCHRKMGELLPRSMVPGLFVPLQGLPRTSTGKLDRKALRQWAADLSDHDLPHYQVMTTVTSRKPETQDEKCLQYLWSRVLGVAEASLAADDNFLWLGGDSVMAMELVNGLRGEGKSITFQQVFENPRLCDMATQLAGNLKEPVYEALTPPFVLIKPETHVFECICEAAQASQIDDVNMIEDIYPATPMQEAVLTISARRPEAYRNRAIFKLPDTLHLRRFMWAWETLVAMQSIFRTRIVLLQDHGLIQIVIRPGITWKDSPSLKQYLREDDENTMGHGTELSRFAIVSDRDDGGTYFVWSGHHAIYDGWSLPKAFAQLASIYNGQTSLKSVVPFSRFVRYLNEVDVQAMDSFWRGQFARIDAKFPELPSADYASAPARLRNFTVKLDRVAKSSITTATLIKAAWAIVTAHQVGAAQAAFGLTLSGRDVPISGITEVIGPVITTVPLNIDVSNKSQSVTSFLQDIQSQVLQVKRFQHAGLQHIRRISLEAQWASTFHNLLVIHPVERSQTYDQLTSELGVHLVDSKETDFLDYCLTTKCTIGSGVLHIKVHFDEKVISDDQIQRMMQRFEHVILQLADGPSTLTGYIQVASPHDLEQLIDWNAVPSTNLTTVHDLVEGQARQRPGAIAIIGFDGAFTYAELDSMATTLGQELTRTGVGPEVRVVLCFTKSTWPIVAMLATLKCGGVCVSVNPEDPDRRLSDICEDVEATILLCDATFKHRFSNYVSNVLVVDSSLIARSRSFESSNCRWSRPTVLPSNSAFVVYTSGSTGKPKGSVLEHQSICTCLNAVGTSLDLGPHCRVLQFCAYTFDMHLLEIFAP